MKNNRNYIFLPRGEESIISFYSQVNSEESKVLVDNKLIELNLENINYKYQKQYN